MSLRAAVRLALTTCLSLCLASVGATTRAQGEYYPHGDDLRWTYDSGVTQHMRGPHDVDGTSVMVLTHYLDGTPVSEDYLMYGPDGVRSLGTAAGGQVMRYEPPLLIYPAPPLEIGTTWRSTTDLGVFSITLDAEVVALRGIQTPVGRFNALQVRQRTLTSTGASTLLDLFFVPGVGVVRFVTQDGTVVDLIEHTR